MIYLGIIIGMVLTIGLIVVFSELFPEELNLDVYDTAINDCVEKEDYRTAAELKVMKEKLHLNNKIMNEL